MKDPARPLVNGCYDHLGGRLGEALLASLLKKKWIEGSTETRGYSITDRGWIGLEAFGVDIEGLRSSRRKIASSCVERRGGKVYEHPGAHLGAKIAQRFFELGWLSKKGKKHEITRLGIKSLAQFGISLSSQHRES
jgi:hypothetical protein